MTNRIAGLVVALTCLLAAPASATPPNAPQNWPVGRVITPKGPICTGVLIGEYTVLTAAHCLTKRSKDGYFSPSLVHFALYPDSDDYLYGKAEEIHVAPGYTLPPSTEPEQLRHDWGVLVLDEPLGRKLTPARLRLGRDWLSGKDLALRIVAFGRARTLRPTIRIENCTATPLDGGLVKTDCTVEPGSSGSVLLGQSASGEIFALAVNVAVRRRGEKSATISTPISQAIAAHQDRAPEASDAWVDPFGNQ